MLDGSSTLGGAAVRTTVSVADGAALASAAGPLPLVVVATVANKGRSAGRVLGGEAGAAALDNGRVDGGSCTDTCVLALLETGAGGAGVGAAFCTGAANCIWKRAEITTGAVVNGSGPWAAVWRPHSAHKCSSSTHAASASFLKMPGIASENRGQIGLKAAWVLNT